MKISEIIKKAKNSENDLSDEILAVLDNKEALLELGFEDLEYCFENKYISKKDLSFVFEKGDRNLKLAVMDLGFNPARAGLNYAKKNNDFEIASRVFELGVDVVKDDFVWAVNQDKTEFYKYFKDRPNLIPYSLINKMMNEKRYEDVVKIIEVKGKLPDFLLKHKDYLHLLEFLDQNLWPEVDDDVLRRAAESGNLEVFKLALEYNPEVTKRVLLNAARSGNVEVFKLALEYNPEVTKRVLLNAAKSGNAEVFKLSLEHSKEVDEDVLSDAARSGNAEVFKLALEYNKDVDYGVLRRAAKSGNLEVFKLSLEHSKEVDDWVLRGAADSGNMEVFKLALEHNPEVTKRVLEWAAESGNLELIKLALEYNKEVDDWALRYAAESGNLEVFKLALEYNSEVDEGVLIYAAKSGNLEVFKLALEYNSIVSRYVLGAAAESGNLELIKLALERNPEVTDWVLKGAAKSGSVEVFKLAIDKKYPGITETFGELDLLSFDFELLNKSLEYKNLSKSLFGVVKPSLTLAINQIVTEEGFGFFNFLYLLKEMNFEYEIKDVLKINKKGEVLDKLDINASTELVDIIKNSSLYELVFNILKTPKALAKFLSNKDLNNYRDTSRSFDFLINNLENTEMTEKDLVKIVVKRAKEGSIKWLHDDLSVLSRKIEHEDYDLNQDISEINNKKLEGSDGEYTVIIPKTYHELVDISAVANICVGDPGQEYGERCADGRIYLVELRKNGKFIAMLEIEDGEVVQQQTYNGDGFNDEKAISELLKLIL